MLRWIQSGWRSLRESTLKLVRTAGRSRCQEPPGLGGIEMGGVCREESLESTLLLGYEECCHFDRPGQRWSPSRVDEVLWG